MDGPTGLGDVLRSLAAKRPAFHAEADFQFALAWELQELCREKEDPRIRMEWIPPCGGRTHIDTLATVNGRRTAIELKYSKRPVGGSNRIVINDETFTFGENPDDVARHGFLRDIERLEGLLRAEQGVDCGCAVLLTNNWLCWKEPRPDSKGHQFSTHDQRVVMPGLLRWKEDTAQTTKSNYADVNIAGRYVMRWRDYATVCEANGGLFRYLLVDVEREGLVKQTP